MECTTWPITIEQLKDRGRPLLDGRADSWKAGQHEMGKPYSDDLRQRVVGAGQDGATIREIAEQIGVSIRSVVRFCRPHRETGSISPAKFGGYKGYVLAAREELVGQLVAYRPGPQKATGLPAF
jgi:transposase-like protein